MRKYLALSKEVLIPCTLCQANDSFSSVAISHGLSKSTTCERHESIRYDFIAPSYVESVMKVNFLDFNQHYTPQILIF